MKQTKYGQIVKELKKTQWQISNKVEIVGRLSVDAYETGSLEEIQELKPLVKETLKEAKEFYDFLISVRDIMTEIERYETAVV